MFPFTSSAFSLNDNLFKLLKWCVALHVLTKTRACSGGGRWTVPGLWYVWRRDIVQKSSINKRERERPLLWQINCCWIWGFVQDVSMCSFAGFVDHYTVSVKLIFLFEWDFKTCRLGVFLASYLCPKSSIAEEFLPFADALVTHMCFWSNSGRACNQSKVCLQRSGFLFYFIFYPCYDTCNTRYCYDIIFSLSHAE